jgi:membrane-associated phospholipid phosphatase
MAFAAAMCMAVAIPRWSAAFFVWAVAVAAERVLENAHYVSDVIAGAGLGIVCGLLGVWLARRIIHESTPKEPESEIPDRPMAQLATDE